MLGCSNGSPRCHVPKVTTMRYDIALILAAVCHAVGTASAQVEAPKEVVFAVQYGDALEIDPIVVFQTGEWLDPRGHGGEDVPMRWRAYYAAQPELQLLAHNEVIAVGHADSSPPPLCFDLLGVLRADESTPLTPGWVGLAASGRPIGGAPLGRPATAAERERLGMSARRLARSGGVEDSLVVKLEPYGPPLAVMDATGAALATAGAFRISSWITTPEGWEVDRLVAVFLILKADGGVWLEWLNDATGNAVASRSLVDVADLTMDATPELVVKSLGYEGWSYEVYDLADGEWSRIFTGGGGGC